jgi:predicted MPP superfamily phosphohydrolase
MGSSSRSFRPSEPGWRLSRRRFLRLAAVTGLELAAIGGLGAYALWGEPGWIQLERVAVPIPGLPAGLAGLRIAQLSDLHAGPDLPQERLERAIQTVAGLAPDLLVTTGDWVIRDARDAILASQAVARLDPPLGNYTILGNHDHWTDPGIVASAVESAGLTLLRNSHVPISAGAQTLWLAGVDDIWEQRHDLDEALAGIPRGAPVILLAHEPDYADTVAQDGRVLLQLSGHSHGGQVHLPLIGSPILPYLGTKYFSGLYSLEGGMQLYTNRGLGLIRPPVRLNCRPEITLITLNPAE